MKIQILGCGVVGFASGQWYSRYGHEVTFVDVSEKQLEKASKLGFRTLLAPEMTGHDIHFICTPEDAVPDVVDLISSCEGPIVIRSTVLPGTTASLAKRYGREDIFHNPEFLREATALDDLLFCKRVLIGYIPEVHEDKLATIYAVYTPMGVDIDAVSGPENTEMAKLVLNMYLATQVTFWNQIHLLCDRVGLNSHYIASLITRVDSRVSTYGALKHGAPYGLRCLPKDTARLHRLFIEKEIKDDLIAAVQEINRYMGVVKGVPI